MEKIKCSSYDKEKQSNIRVLIFLISFTIFWFIGQQVGVYLAYRSIDDQYEKEIKYPPVTVCIDLKGCPGPPGPF